MLTLDDIKQPKLPTEEEFRRQLLAIPPHNQGNYPTKGSSGITGYENYYPEPTLPGIIIGTGTGTGSNFFGGRKPTQIGLASSEPQAITAFVQNILEKSGMTKAKLAKELGVSRQSMEVYKLRRSTSSNRATGLSLRWLARIVGAMGGKIYVEFPADGVRK